MRPPVLWKLPCYFANFKQDMDLDYSLYVALYLYFLIKKLNIYISKVYKHIKVRTTIIWMKSKARAIVRSTYLKLYKKNQI